ncbi:di-heme-cytochrome C peroxidase [Catenovulum sediminis]|uniref:di-heme-cytochrome C peroxidase n=1 Tax=Catenovulum sediminis TaxID=1740262 RepID=UPI00117F910E|nr:di-heme-cytochrome C peroxidase [Catenovulum sediminis]
MNFAQINIKLWLKLTTLFFLILIVIIGFSFYWKHQARFADKDALRGIQYIENKQFKEGFARVYPGPDFPNSQPHGKWQGWNIGQSMWYYNATQGSNLLPYDFFLFLEQHDNRDLFRSEQNIDKFRYIVQRTTKQNPDGLPLGFVKDIYRDKEYVGLTCAACHTSQVVYDGVAIRIDGGPSMANMDGFMRELEIALTSTLNSETKKQRFINAILQYNKSASVFSNQNYSSAGEISADLEKYVRRVSLYNFINSSPISYGYARLDAFGRIYNRVLQHVINKKQLERAICDAFDAATAKQLTETLEEGLVASDDLTHIFDKLVAQMDLHSDSDKLVENMQKLQMLKKMLFNIPDAPVSYPFLWDIAQHDYVQWNGIAANSGVGAIGRNTGEVMGVFATLDWHEDSSGTLSTLIGGQRKNENGKYTHFKSSIDVTNLRLIESQLKALQSPPWPEAVLPSINRNMAYQGKKLFLQHCSDCHQNIDPTNPSRKVVAQMLDLNKIKTDDKMALNSTQYQGHTGILEGIYLSTEVGNMLMQEKAPVASILTSATTNVVATPDPDKYFFTRWFDWLYNLTVTAFDNDIKPSIKRGDYMPDTTANPYASLHAYKGRPLNGIWATAPYLHNGSVPTLYDLLLPKCTATEYKENQCRPNKFMVGSRSFEPKKVGFVSEDYDGFEFDTSLTGNSNAGHEYATGELSDKQRWQLVEYMKTL